MPGVGLFGGRGCVPDEQPNLGDGGVELRFTVYDVRLD
jgi:hypothetical protein